MHYYHRHVYSEACAGKDVCDRNIAIKKHFLRKWVKKSRECSTAHHIVQGLAEMRMGNSYASLCVAHDINFKPLDIRKTKEAKLMGRMSDIVFDHDTSGEPLGLRVREQYEIGPHKVILAKQLVLPTNLCTTPTNMTIIAHCKIGEEVVTHAKPKVEHKKEKKLKYHLLSHPLMHVIKYVIRRARLKMGKWKMIKK